MIFGGYEHWMLRFSMLRKLDATLLDALIATRKQYEIYVVVDVIHVQYSTCFCMIVKLVCTK